jgi:hypothetical protein
MVSACETRQEQPPRANPSCGDEILSDEGVGKLRIGKSVESMRSECTVVRDTTAAGAEGMPSRKIAVLFPRDTVLGEIVNDKVWRVEIHSPHFSTADSLRVGTPLARLLALRKPQGMTGEGALFVKSREHCGLSFRLSETGSPILRDPGARALSQLPSTTRVSDILIVGCHK